MMEGAKGVPYPTGVSPAFALFATDDAEQLLIKDILKERGSKVPQSKSTSISSTVVLREKAIADQMKQEAIVSETYKRWECKEQEEKQVRTHPTLSPSSPFNPVVLFIVSFFLSTTGLGEDGRGKS